MDRYTCWPICLCMRTFIVFFLGIVRMLNVCLLTCLSVCVYLRGSLSFALWLFHTAAALPSEVLSHPITHATCLSHMLQLIWCHSESRAHVLQSSSCAWALIYKRISTELHTTTSQTSLRRISLHDLCILNILISFFTNSCQRGNFPLRDPFSHFAQWRHVGWSNISLDKIPFDVMQKWLIDTNVCDLTATLSHFSFNM